MTDLEHRKAPSSRSPRPRPPLPLLLACAALSCAPPAARPSPALPPPPAPASFCTLRDSDVWVTASMRIQRTYPRVLAVSSTERPRSLRIRPFDPNARAPSAEIELPVTQTFTTLQAAADAARGGDLVAVLPGRYDGFVLDEKPDAGDERYIHFQAVGALGTVTIDRPARTDEDRWMVLIRAAHHVVIEGFEIAGSGTEDPQRGWAGIMLDGDFGRSGKLTHHVVVARNHSHHHRNWGLHSTDTHTVLIQDNVFAASVREHSAYVSDGSDDYVIRRNVFFGSNGSGLQCNLDPESSIEEILKHPAFAGYAKGESQAWAAGVIARATALFGEHNYPDGRGVNFIIEENVINGNGRAGGGALNLAGLSDSLIQNNLLYGNLAHGIAQWNDANPYDREREDPGPRAVSEVVGPASLPTWGCHGNVIRNNTVIMANRMRAAFQAVRGSWGSVVYNNVLINDEASSIEVSNTGAYHVAFGPNVVNTVALTRGAEALAPLMILPPDPTRVLGGITRQRFAAEVVRYGEEPWILLEGHGWRLNPDRPDFHPRAGSPLLAGKADPRELPARDLDGLPRRSADIGALSAR
ncbi:MAG: right-handed parallel beta-helix repeat-containing protein [Minicystis sp.]